MSDKIGLKRGTVVLKSHHREWVEAFEIEKNNLRNLLGDFVVDLQHIGSTSVPGLLAKPVIDMLAGVRSLTQVSKIKSALEGAGYEYRENGSDSTQVLFVKGSEECRTHYLHITEFGSTVWQNDLAFRDYLCSHAEAVTDYEKLKKDLASQYPSEREKYTSGKEIFIRSIILKAGKR